MLFLNQITELAGSKGMLKVTMIQANVAPILNRRFKEIFK
jgi:hypothetical protein